ncbi:1,2-phenylacetyl-CoA epoxidase subunit PaaD [Actinopolymorpha alba]|uniref:1,2-phenylacetyl-CoA epoxidase subunit PaaD n=1 Tax=Actinopolymorpha alba TaxID=533267 RepID=UPI000A2F6052|nr:1,2-phenylacetyl-CoA epoxidase subunit PaaD [Actinopolymorpha alba]
MTGQLTAEAAYDAAARVVDPELPVLTIAELGILRGVRVDDSGCVEVDLTPTYSGCPALEAIREDVKDALRVVGAGDVSIRTILAPAWSTDWISAVGQRKLAEAGIAPPHPRGEGPVSVGISVRCPRCGSPDTQELSRFGPTSCTALRTCAACGEPFEHVKAL